MILIQEHSYSEHPNIYIPWCSDIRMKNITDTPAYQQKSGVLNRHTALNTTSMDQLAAKPEKSVWKAAAS